ncbi:hypothetical protein IGI04_014904, partial [Brassica rapa subsp. trilocularis]
KIFFSASPVLQTGVPGVRHSTFESLRLGRSSQSISSGLLRFWDSMNFKKDIKFMGITVLFLDEKVSSVIYGFIPAGRANNYMPSLKGGSIVKVDRFEVARCSSMYKITDHPFFIRFISPTIIGEVIKGAPEINLQALTSPKKQIESLFVSSLIRKKQSTRNYLYITVYIVLKSIIKNISYPRFVVKQTQSHQEIRETIPTDTKATTTSPPAHSSCIMKIAYMSNVNRPMILFSYEKYIYSFKTH